MKTSCFEHGLPRSRRRPGNERVRGARLQKRKESSSGETAAAFCLQKTQAAQQARENGAGEDEAFLYGLGEVVKRIGGQQLEEYFRSKAGELFTRGEVQAMSPREISENYDAIRESMGLWDKDGRLPENTPGSDVIDSESPMGDNEENGISGQSSGLPQGSGHNEKPMVDTPFGDAGYLKPNVRYQAGEFDYFYETDEQGRICNWNTEDLQLTFREERLPHNSKAREKTGRPCRTFGGGQIRRFAGFG